MNIVDHKPRNEKIFKDVFVTELVEYADTMYMKIPEIKTGDGCTRNVVRLLDGLCFHFNPDTKVKLVQHELRILS